MNKEFKKLLEDNATHILTGCSMVLTGATLGLGIRAGMKIREDLDELDEDADTLDKVKAVVPHVIPPAITAAGAMACSYAADKTATTKIAMLAGTVAVTQSENKYLKTFKEKAEEKLGKKKSEEVRQETEAAVKNQPPMGYLTKWRDNELGFEFWTTAADFDNAVEMYNDEFNSMSEDDQREGLPISRFYEILLVGKYEHMSKHDDYGLQYDGVLSFRPFGKNRQGRVLEDGTLGWQFEYEISNLVVPELHVS